jgi:hypothetical protein
VTPDHERLARLIRGEHRGFTRAELTHRLRMHDRQVRALIEDLVAGGHYPIVADRTAGGEARYRIARRDEIDLVNAEAAELRSRAVSLIKRAKGLENSFMTHHEMGALFFSTVEDDAA